MKKMIYLILLSVLPSSLILADHGHNHLEGLWYARNGFHDLRIKVKSYGLKIRGLDGDRSWRKMRHTRMRNVYIDRRGNAVEIINRNHIVYLPSMPYRYRTRRQGPRNEVHYVRGDRRFRNGCVSDGYYRERSNRDVRYDLYDSADHQYGSREGYNSSVYSDHRSVENLDRYRNDMIGTWTSRTLDKKVYIKINDNGIKARFAGSSKWSFYYRDKADKYSFIDRKGNRYVLKNKNILEWIAYDGRKINLDRE